MAQLWCCDALDMLTTPRTMPQFIHNAIMFSIDFEFILGVKPNLWFDLCSSICMWVESILLSNILLDVYFWTSCKLFYWLSTYKGFNIWWLRKLVIDCIPGIEFAFTVSPRCIMLFFGLQFCTCTCYWTVFLSPLQLGFSMKLNCVSSTENFVKSPRF